MIRPFAARDVKPYPPTVLDIETDATNVIGIGFAWFDGTENQYESFESFDEWLAFYTDLHNQEPNKDLREAYRRIYAHNGAGFDWLFLIEWALETGQLSNMDFFASDSFPIGGNIRLEGFDNVIRLRDSYRLLPQSLKALTKTFNVESEKIDIHDLPYLKHLPIPERYPRLKKVNPKLFYEYLRNDVLGLQQVLYRFWQMIYGLVGNIGQLPMTLPSLAMRLWTKTIDEPIKTTWNPRVKALERASYIGGRTECYQAGETDIKTFDINSLYPSVMLGNDFPTSYHGAWTDIYDGEHGIYELTYNQTNLDAKPVLRDSESGTYRYAGRGTYCKPEIDLFLRIGGTINVTKGWVYQETGTPFRHFVAQWWKVRAQANDNDDEALSYVAKILMNSLYGKFGQKEEHETVKFITGEEQEKMMEDGKRFRPFGEFCIVPSSEQHDYVFVGIASYVTSYARVRLYESMHEAEQNGGTIWYCDTDSVHVQGSDIAVSSELGGMKLEYDGYAAYAGKKLYAYKESGKIKAKGVKSAGLLSYGDILSIANDPTVRNLVEYESLPTWREILSGDILPGQAVKRTRTLRQTIKDSS